MKIQRIERLLRLIQHLQSGKSNTAEDLASQVGVSKRTIFRDLDLLSSAGIHYEFDRESKRYNSDRLSLLPPVTLTHAEALAILLAARYVANHPAITDPQAATSAGLKIESMLPASIQDHCETLLDRTEVRFDPASRPAGAMQWLPTVQSAIVTRNKIQIRYDSFYDGQPIDVIVHPYRIAYIHRGWYMIGYTEAFEEIRTFKIERIMAIGVLDNTYAMDSTFNLDKYLGNAWLMIRGDTPYHVRVRFSPMVARNVEEVVWHKTQKTCRQEDGSLIFDVDVDGIDEISWWILGYGQEAEVLEPPALRQKIADRISGMAQKYGGAVTWDPPLADHKISEIE